MNQLRKHIKEKKENKIEIALEELNIKLCKIISTKKNVVLDAFSLIDFTTVSHYNKNTLRTISRYRYKLPNYENELEAFLKKTGFSFPDYKKEKEEAIYYDLKRKKNNNKKLEDTSFSIFDSKIVASYTNAKIDSWHQFVENKFNQQVKSCFTYFEKKPLNEANNEYIEIGIYLLCSKLLTSKQQVEILKILPSFVNQYGSPFIIEEINKRHTNILGNLKNTSLKSSLAAVISRNMSHNVGSHVLNKLSSREAINHFFSIASNKRFVIGRNKKNESQYFEFSEKVNDTNDEELPKLIKEGSEDPKKFIFFSFFEGNDNTPKPIYTLSPFFVDVNNNTTKEELARVFNDYLKKRMDFVADVATSNKALLSSSKYLFADVFRGFERNLLLLHNISGKEDRFSYKFQFQYYKGSQPVENFYEQDGEGNIIVDGNNVSKRNEKFVDPIVAMPNDILGNQAFYIILENIIRNTAKHSGADNVIFTIKVEDLVEDDFFRITVFDNVEYSDPEELNNLVVERNISIAQSVMDSNNEIRTSGWGTIEIKLAACYLSGLDMLKMDEELYAPVGYQVYAEAKKIANEAGADEEKTKKIATKGYVDFLTKENKKDLTIRSTRKKLEVTDCAKTLKRVIKSKEENQTRYPIVQAVNGSLNTNNKSGFGYSFLIKKPKKLLILDKDDKLGLLKNDLKTKNTRQALKQLGINIHSKPKENSIYNHQFMIVIDNEEKEYCSNWFNMPQERFLYTEDSNNDQFLDVFEYDRFERKYLIKNQKLNLEGTLNKILITILENSKSNKCSDFNILYYYLNDCKRIQYTENNNLMLTPEINFTYDTSKINVATLDLKINTEDLEDILNKNEINLKEAKFGHHGLSNESFGNACYAELFGSVNPIGLHLESVSKQLSNNNKMYNTLHKETQYFYEQAVNTNVIVIDERIQNQLLEIGFTVEAKYEKDELKYSSYNLNYNQIFKKTNIYTPSKRVLDLNKANLKEDKTILKTFLKRVSCKTDFLIIHFGILESFRANSKEKVVDILKEIENCLNNSRCKVIITSGRGFTPDIRELNRYFVAYSTISNLLLDPNGRSKAHLISCLNQLRIIKTN